MGMDADNKPAVRLGLRPVIVGEVLFDCFDDGREVLGGAPFNVAWHLQAFGLAPLLISRVGDDPRGQRIREAMQAWGMDLSGLQLDDTHPTGVVAITMQGQQHTFNILPDQAYDHLDPSQALSHPIWPEAGMWYSGSLIERSASARQTIAALRRRNLPHFMDINLREPWWQREAVLAMLQGVNWAKLNDQELHALGYHAEPSQAVAQLRREHDLDWVILTQGEQGALLYDGEGILSGTPVPVGQMVDTVGAGDAFSAVMILGLMRGWPKRVTLQRALAFASAQCEVQGAIREERAWYQRVMASWEESE